VRDLGGPHTNKGVWLRVPPKVLAERARVKIFPSQEKLATEQLRSRT